MFCNKLQGGPLDHNPRKIPVQNSLIIILQNNSKCLPLNDKQMPHEILFSLLQKQSYGGVLFLRKYKVSDNFIKKETLAQVLSCGFCEISKNTFFYRTPPGLPLLLDEIQNIKKMKTRKSKERKFEKKVREIG